MHGSHSPAVEATGRLRKREFKNILCQVRELDRELVTAVFRNLVPETGYMSKFLSFFLTSASFLQCYQRAVKNLGKQLSFGYMLNLFM